MSKHLMNKELETIDFLFSKAERDKKLINEMGLQNLTEEEFIQEASEKKDKDLFKYGLILTVSGFAILGLSFAYDIWIFRKGVSYSSVHALIGLLVASCEMLGLGMTIKGLLKFNERSVRQKIRKKFK